jgi:hypothetical protein
VVPAQGREGAVEVEGLKLEAITMGLVVVLEA